MSAIDIALLRLNHAAFTKLRLRKGLERLTQSAKPVALWHNFSSAFNQIPQ